MRWRYSLYSLGVRITLGGVDELLLAAIETRNLQKIVRMSKPILPEVTNNPHELECVIECWKTRKGENLGVRKALKIVVGEKNRNKWHFPAPKWRSKVTGREINGRRSCRWSAVARSGPTRPHTLARGRCHRREMTRVAAR